jgi:hypothetical protein
MTFHKGLHTRPTFERSQVNPKEKAPTCGTFAEPSSGLEPETSSLPWRFPGVTRVHARSRATQFLLQIATIRT